MRTYLGFLWTMVGATNALADTVDFDTTGSTLNCNGVAGCVQNTATVVTVGGVTITYTSASSTGVTISPFESIGLGSIAASGIGGTSISGVQLALKIHSTPPGLSGTMPATLSGFDTASSTSGTITFPPTNTHAFDLFFCDKCFGVQLSGGGHDYLYGIASSGWTLPANGQTSFTGYIGEDGFTRLHPNANATPQSAPVNTAFPNALGFVSIGDTVSGDSVLSGVTVTFNAPSSGASGLFSSDGKNSDATTSGADGTGTSSTFTANATAGGPYAVVASGAKALYLFPDVVFALTNTPVSASDLSVTIGDGKSFAQGGKTNLYTIVAHNAGPGDVVGATVSDTMPPNLVDAIWECTPDTGAACTASGSGNISDSVNLPNGKSVTYALSVTVVANPEHPVQNMVTVTAPLGVSDANALNNSATDVDNVGIFFSGFE